MGKSSAASKRALVPVERIEQRIYFIRNEKVMLGHDLAELYQVETKQLNRAVRRNIDRFPADFMFQLTAAEAGNLRSQSGTSSSHGGRRYRPLAFTEQGVAMLSAVLQSSRAVAVSIEIIRVFVGLRRLLASHADLRRKLDAMQSKYDHQFAVVFDALRDLMADDERQRRKPPIGFKSEEKGRK
jgi:hypothetical protein